MDFFLGVNWISFLALSIVGILFVWINHLIKTKSWTFVIFTSLILGLIVGLIFTSENNAYLVWVEMIGNAYIQLITALVAPVIFISIVSSFISLKDRKKMASIGLQSIFWLLAAAAAAILLAIFVGVVFNIGANASGIFAEIAKVDQESVTTYTQMTKSFDQVLLALVPSNVINDLANNNVVAIIVIGIAIAVGYLSVSEKGDKMEVFVKLIDSVKKIIYKILSFVIDLTPYAVLCLIAASSSSLFSNWQGIAQLLLLVVLIYATALVHTYLYNGAVLYFVAKLNPIRYFKKISGTQATAFTTQSSVGTLPVSIEDLTKKIGVSEEIANFTAPLGTTIGMPGCTCIWPVLLVIFYVHAVGLNWGIGDYIVLAIVALLMSIGSAGVPGIATVSAISLFSALGLPVAAIVIFVPINTISDMIRTFDNVTSGNVATAIVAKKQGQLNERIFDETESYDGKVVAG